MINDNDYLYNKIKHQIIEYIKDLPTGTRIPSRTDLTGKFGVTRTTIDRAVSELIGEGYFYSRVGSGTYILERNSRRSNGSQRDLASWGLIILNITHDSYPETLRGVEDVCSENGINLIVCNTDNKIEKQEMYIKRLIDFGVSGLIIVPAIGRLANAGGSFELLEKSGMKYVLCNRGVEGVGAPKVVSNDYYGANIATKHLLKSGWKRPAYISRPFYSVSEQRCHGYLAALYEYCIPIRNELIKYEKSFDCEDNGYEAMKELLRSQQAPDSVFCFNDRIAEGVYRAVEEMGLRVSKDIGIVSHDDTNICEKLSVKLTSVRYPKYEIGYEAAKILLDLINGKEYEENHSVVLQPSLSIRESCGESGTNSREGCAIGQS